MHTKWVLKWQWVFKVKKGTSSNSLEVDSGAAWWKWMLKFWGVILTVQFSKPWNEDPMSVEAPLGFYSWWVVALGFATLFSIPWSHQHHGMKSIEKCLPLTDCWAFIHLSPVTRFFQVLHQWTYQLPANYALSSFRFQLPSPLACPVCSHLSEEHKTMVHQYCHQVSSPKEKFHPF